MDSIPNQLETIEEKLRAKHRNRITHFSNITEEKARRNSERAHHVLEFAEKKKTEESERHAKFERDQKEKERKLRRVYKEINLLFTDFKTAQSEKRGQMQDRHSQEEHSRRERAADMMKKLQRS